MVDGEPAGNKHGAGLRVLDGSDGGGGRAGHHPGHRHRLHAGHTTGLSATENDGEENGARKENEIEPEKSQYRKSE